MNKNRVLIVDDNEMFIELARFVLTAAAYEVDVAADASHALSQIPVFLPDLILMDVQMPVMGGLELTQRLKADPTTRHIVIVAFTAYALKGDAPKLQAAGCRVQWLHRQAGRCDDAGRRSPLLARRA